MKNNLFNIDFVKAKTGKILSKTEKNIQYILNLLISWDCWSDFVWNNCNDWIFYNKNALALFNNLKPKEDE